LEITALRMGITAKIEMDGSLRAPKDSPCATRIERHSRQTLAGFYERQHAAVRERHTWFDRRGLLYCEESATLG